MFTRKELTEWTSALRANPEQQFTRQLANKDYTRFCCLGKLCEVRGVGRAGDGSYFSPSSAGVVMGTLPGNLSLNFTGESDNATVRFKPLCMPDLEGFTSAVQANDCGCTWIEIADHFDKYYPCSDEKEGENGKA